MAGPISVLRRLALLCLLWGQPSLTQSVLPTVKSQPARQPPLVPLAGWLAGWLAGIPQVDVTRSKEKPVGLCPPARPGLGQDRTNNNKCYHQAVRESGSQPLHLTGPQIASWDHRPGEVRHDDAV